MKRLKTNLDINNRWESGKEHHPKTLELYELIQKIDWKLQSDSLSLTSGGDGDNGESLMFCLDIIHDAEDFEELDRLKKFLENK